MVDLHTHSTSSDGTMSPEQLVEHASALGMRAIALTDHDTVEGVEAAQQAATRCGITIIPGIEIEVNVPEEDDVPGICHILGLGLRSWKGTIEAHLASILDNRDRRNRSIISRMKLAGVKIEYDDVKAYAGDGVVGRPHIARFMVEQQLAHNELHAFKEYLGEFGTYFVPRDLPSLEDGIRMIHEAGGLAVLAHPYTLFVSWTGLADRLIHWQRLGLDGVEAYHSNIRYNQAKRIAELAQSLGLIVSAGSDFHGLQRHDRKLGRTSDGRKIDDSFALPFIEHMSSK
ncbi:MAG TPA: PHP domain-containing protein [Spirochaetia bacterium]|nr:PHP domain-containing protein [Spirochaetia bacterium]